MQWLLSLHEVSQSQQEVFFKETTPQRKRYEPAWLAGTSVGDVMFQARAIWHDLAVWVLLRMVTQADYFLKELALGEYTMPIVGMMLLVDICVTDPDITRGLR